MNPDPNDFEALRKLMALKRHEQPAPDYLEHLSGSIIGRIERGEGQLGFFDRLSANFSARPTLFCACGLTLCGALGITTVYIARQGVNEEVAAQATTPPSSRALAVLTPSRASVAAPIALQTDSEEVPLHVAGWLRNTNPASETLPVKMSLFDTTPHTTVQVSYHNGN